MNHGCRLVFAAKEQKNSQKYLEHSGIKQRPVEWGQCMTGVPKSELQYSSIAKSVSSKEYFSVCLEIRPDGLKRHTLNICVKA